MGPEKRCKDSVLTGADVSYATINKSVNRSKICESVAKPSQRIRSLGKLGMTKHPAKP